MSSEDQLRLEILSLENRVNDLSSRVNGLTAEVITGRTEMAEHVARLQVDVTSMKRDLDDIKILIVDLPRLFGEQLAEVLSKKQ